MANLPKCDTLLLEEQDGRLHMTLNRPEVKNAISWDTIRDMTEVIDAVRDDPSIRTIVIRGSQGMFCAGGDIKGFQKGFTSVPPVTGEKDSIAIDNRVYGTFLDKLNRQPQTVVAIVEGAAFGGGLGLICATDVAICMADTKFALSETGLGIPPAQIAPFVVQRIGLTRTRHIALTGARFDGRMAHELGIVQYVCETPEDLDETVAKVLKFIGKCAPGANAATKKILHASLTEPLEQVLDDAADAFAAQLRGPEGKEGVLAFLEKRPANWTGKTS